MSADALALEGLCLGFRLPSGERIAALGDVSLCVRQGEIYGLVGESGSGKSTLARCVMGLIRPDRGRIFCQGREVTGRLPGRRGPVDRQLVFQDAASSLSGRLRLWEIVSEPLEIQGIGGRRERRALAAEALEAVGLEAALLDRRPGELSGGQCRRAAIARALILEPALLAADEPAAGLDVSVQGQILNLFRDLQRQRGFSLLLISHDMAAVRAVCQRVGVLHRGRLVEEAPAEELFAHPLHPRTRALLSAAGMACPETPGEAGHFVLQEEEEEAGP